MTSSVDSVLVPTTITEEQADVLGMPKMWFERAVARASQWSASQPITYGNQPNAYQSNESFETIKAPLPKGIEDTPGARESGLRLVSEIVLVELREKLGKIRDVNITAQWDPTNGPVIICDQDIKKSAQDILAIISSLSLPQWRGMASAPMNGVPCWVGNDNNLCVAYYNLGRWRNWFKGCNYKTPFPPEAFAPDPIWFEPTMWMEIPKLPHTVEEINSNYQPGFWYPIDTAPTFDCQFYVGRWDGETRWDEEKQENIFIEHPIWKQDISHPENPNGPFRDRGWNHRNGAFGGRSEYWSPLLYSPAIVPPYETLKG